MLEKYMNQTSKKIVATTLALTLTFSSCAAISSFKIHAEPEGSTETNVKNDIEQTIGSEDEKYEYEDEEYEEYEEYERNVFEDAMFDYINMLSYTLQEAEDKKSELKAAMEEAEAAMNKEAKDSDSYILSNIHTKAKGAYKEAEENYEKIKKSYDDKLKSIEEALGYTVEFEYYDESEEITAENNLKQAIENESESEKILAITATELANADEENSSQLEDKMDAIGELENTTDMTLLKIKATTVLNQLEKEYADVNRKFLRLSIAHLSNETNYSITQEYENVKTQKSDLGSKIEALSDACRADTKDEFDSKLNGYNDIIAEIEEAYNNATKTEDTDTDVVNVVDILKTSIENENTTEEIVAIVAEKLSDTDEKDSEQLEESLDEALEDENEADVDLLQAKALVGLNIAQADLIEATSDYLNSIGNSDNSDASLEECKEQFLEASNALNAAEEALNAKNEQEFNDALEGFDELKSKVEEVYEEAKLDLEEENILDEEDEYEEDEYEEDEYEEYEYEEDEQDNDYNEELNNLLVDEVTTSIDFKNALTSFKKAKNDYLSALKEYISEEKVEEARTKLNEATIALKEAQEKNSIAYKLFYAYPGSIEYAQKYRDSIYMDKLTEALEEAENANAE